MTLSTDTLPEAAARAAERNPAGRRRLVFALLVGLSWAGLMLLTARMLAPGGIDLADVVLLVLFGLYLPWSLFGFWNAFIGFLIMRFARDPLALTCPPAALGSRAPVASDTAILMCVRNEDTDRVFRNLGLMLDQLDRSGEAERFTVYVLSDSNRPEIGAAEEAAAAALERRYAGRIGGVVYRRRETNPGFKAGNIRDFCERWGDRHVFAVVLDADSYMSAERILRMVRIADEEPKLGILQSLTVGLPSTSPLARLFQFGMRLGMRSYTLGSAWWHADCGPYWGHNALIRLAPFTAACHMPKLPGGPPLGGDIMSHDQVEAVLMRKAGYDVRVVPEEGGSFEENPTTLVEFIRRDMRWCMGNMQYWKLLGMPGILPTSRFQLIVAVVMFVASPAYVLMWSLALALALLRRGETWIDPGPAYALIAAVAFLMLAPKIATAVDVLLSREGRLSFGGGVRFAIGFVTETLFAFLLTPISMLSHTIMMTALLFGRSVGWTAQNRDAHSVPFGEALGRFWPHTLVGLAAAIGLAFLSPLAPLYAAPVYLGLLVAVPFATLTSSPAFGRLMIRIGLCRIPEEIDVPAELAPMGLTAIALATGRA
jgi:membrane glycosyltransferase